MTHPVAQTLQELAARLEAQFSTNQALAWFDGFWDFVVVERPRLTAGPSWEVSGISHGRNYCLIAWERAGQPRFDVFVEAKDYRAGVVAPWPVSSIYLHDGSAVPPSQLPQRPFVPAHVETLTAWGFTLKSSYWGPHVYRLGAMDFTVDQLSRILDAAMGLLS